MKRPVVKTADKRNWEKKYCSPDLRNADFSSISGRPLEPLYTREDLSGFDA